jgi:PAS domain S-box-containing protein
VLAVLRPVTGTTWSLVTKLDEDEVMSDVRLSGIMLLICCASLGVVSILVLVFIWYRKAKELTRERDRAEAERQVLTRHYINLSKYANDIILLADETQRIIEVNERALASYGYPRETILSMRLADFMPPHLKGAMETMVRRLEREHALVFETEHQRRDGEVFPVEVSLRRIGEGGLNYYQAIIRDTAERRQRQLLFERYQLLSRHARDIIIFVRADGRIIEANVAAETAYGYSREELTTMTIADLHAEEGRVALRTQLDEADARGITFETVHRRKDGTTFPVEVGSTGVTIGEDRVLLSIIRDTTDRMQAAQALEASEKNLRQVIDLLPHAIYARDQTGRLILVNRRFAELTGLTREELLEGHSDGWPGDAARAEACRRDDQEVIRTGESKIIPGETWVDREGVSLMMQTTKVPFTPAGSGEKAVLCVSIDITEIKRLEEELAQSQKMEGVGRLAGGIAHDFNNLLQVIIGFNDILLERLGEQHPGRKDAMEVALAAKRASSLTRQLLAYSRKQLLVAQVVDLNGIVEKATPALAGLLGKNIELVTRLDPSLRPVNVDPGQIEQVLMNLVSNAADAMPAGGRVTLQTKPFRVGVSDIPQMAKAKAGSYACLSVSDIGTGMSRASLDHLFEPFFTTKGQGNGTGLGLAMVDGIVRQHEGWIHVYSQEGMGTTVKVFLPVADQAVDREPPVQEIVVSPTDGPCRILVVEDEDSVRQFAVRVLRERGFEVVAARTGGDALTLFGEWGGDFHIVFSDVVLPDTNGLDLVRQLRQKQPRIRLLLTSGYMDEQSRWPEIRRERIAFIQKPYPGRELLLMIQTVLGSVS